MKTIIKIVKINHIGILIVKIKCKKLMRFKIINQKNLKELSQ